MTAFGPVRLPDRPPGHGPMHFALHLCRDRRRSFRHCSMRQRRHACRRCRRTPRQHALHRCPRSCRPSRPLKRRGGSNPPGPPASIPPSLMLHDTCILDRGAAVSSHPTQQAAGCSRGCECPRWSAQDIDSAQICASLSCREKSAAEARPALSLGRALKSARIQGTKRAGAAWACSLRRRSAYPFSNRGRFSGARPLARRP